MKNKSIFNKIVKTVEETLFPHYVCPFCETETPNGTMCADCEKYYIQPKFCAKCGEHITEDSLVCNDCKEVDRIFDQSFSVLNYEDKVAIAIQKLKFKQAKFLAKDFAKILAGKYATLNIKVDVVTFVPCTANRIKERGYNQAKEIAQEFCLLTGLPFAEVLSKTKETLHQTELTKKQRLQNLIGSFSVVDKWFIKGKNILVIDDVFTTGSTMIACAKELRKAKADKIYCLTLAKTAIKK